MEVHFVIPKEQLRGLFGQISFPPETHRDKQPEKQGYSAPVDSSAQMFQDIALQKETEKRLAQAAETLWNTKRSEFEAHSESVARKIANQWQKDRKSLEQVFLYPILYL
jgi:hypothetical protein